MTNTSPMLDELSVLIPEPRIFKFADGKEIRVQALPSGRVLKIIRFVVSNKDLLDKLQGSAFDDPAVFIEGEIYKRINALVRLVVTPADKHEFMTDEWCLDHMTHAHYRAIMNTVLEQNEMKTVFQKAKSFVGAFVVNALRQAQIAKETETT